MSKVPRKLPQPNKDMEQPTSSSEQRKKTKSPYQPRSKGGGKVLKTTLKVKRPVQKSLSKKVSVKTTNPIRKPKKAGTPVFGHYHSLNERLNQNEPEQAQEKVEESATSNDDPGSQ
ncbi:uncharacterized protein CXorf51A-like [Lutra lutra]|uniref:uncharacterized protein CXorf51A-like n=1 Tax=Lutra lutra TaxID=9657 RepID=UPI001FD14F32|nr:uncharacterized protein CXorf51A-like [Lutra lutra]